MFRFLKITLIVIIVTLVLCASSLHVFVKREGRRIVCDKLKEIFGREVTIGSIRTAFPLDIVIRDLKIEGLGSVRQAIFWGGFTDIFKGNLNLTELRLIGVDVEVVKAARHKVELPPEEVLPPADGTVAETPVPVVPVPEAPAPVVQQPAMTVSHAISIKKVIFSDSLIHFVDEGAGDGVINVTVAHVAGYIRNLQFPAMSQVVTSFKLSGVLPWENAKDQGSIDLNGWINLSEKDMRAELKVRDIDGLSFYPYYAGWLNMEKTNVSRARLNFESQITGLKNDVVMDCHLEMTELKFKDHREGEPEPKEEKLTSAIFDIVRALNQGKVALDFKIHTTMDSPEFGGGVIKSAFDAKVDQVIKSEYVTPRIITAPARIVGGTFKAAAELTRSLINGTVGIGRAVTSTFKSSFNKDRPAVPEAAK